MEFLISAKTDIGMGRESNQDSVMVKTAAAPDGSFVFAVVCDGMGGLADGDYASRTMAEALERWFLEQFPMWYERGQEDAFFRSSITEIIRRVNEELIEYGQRRGARCGTTATAMLLSESRYCIAHVGDTRAYCISDGLRQLTADHTLAAREVAFGRMTEEEAEDSLESHVLTQCVGAGEGVAPDFYFGNTGENAVYLLCSDGFRQELTKEELFEAFDPARVTDGESMSRACEELFRLSLERYVNDNLSVIAIRTVGAARPGRNPRREEAVPLGDTVELRR